MAAGLQPRDLHAHGFGTPQRRADHRAAAGRIHEHERVYRRRPEAVRAHPQLIVHPPGGRRHAQHRHDEDAGWNRRPLEVLHLPGCLVRQIRGGDVEPREPAHPADDEVGEDQHVPPAAQPEREAEHRGRHAEGDDVGQRVEVRAEHRLPRPVLARDVAVEHVTDQRQRQQQEGKPEPPLGGVGHVVEAQEDRDGAAGGVADCQQVCGRVRPQHREVADGTSHVVVNVTGSGRSGGSGRSRGSGGRPAWPRDQRTSRPAGSARPADRLAGRYIVVTPGRYDSG